MPQTLCPAGYYCEAGETAPHPCPAGTYKAHASNADCTACADTEYCGLTGLTAPAQCPRGNLQLIYGTSMAYL